MTQVKPSESFLNKSSLKNTANLNINSIFQKADKVPAIEISNLSFSYKNTTNAHEAELSEQNESQVLSNINYTLAKGSLLAVLGPNGGGKTTLLRLLLGFLEPDTGEIKIFGQSPNKVMNQLGYVPQFTSARLDFPTTVEETVMMGAAKANQSFSLFKMGHYWKNNKNNKDKAHYLLSELGLDKYTKSQISELSGGQRQRAFIARALMGWQEGEDFLLLLDEPTSSVDPAGKFCFYEFLNTLKGKITSLVISHDLTTASNIFSHLVVVNHTLVEAEAITVDAHAQQNCVPMAFSTNINLESIFGKHEHECPCPVSSFIKAASHQEDEQKQS